MMQNRRGPFWPAALRHWHAAGLLWAVAGALLLGGCAEQPIEFKLNFEGLESLQERVAAASSVEAAQQARERYRRVNQALVDGLVALFGTPDAPYADPRSGLRQELLNIAAGPSGGHGIDPVTGARLGGLYREHCAHCHGITGDGLGPTARYLVPYPRDYRKGVFKFTSTETGAKPTLEDLRRVIRDGIHGTAMPAFAVMLSPSEIDALAEYVKYLAIRGEVEIVVRDALENQDEELTADLLGRELEYVAETWAAAEDRVLQPPQRRPFASQAEYLASVERGRQLFQDEKKAQCVKCHGPTALGDGGEVLFDSWNEPKKQFLNNPDVLQARWSLPPQPLQARNLRLGIYRGGRRPVDVYRRIAAGIKGTPMPQGGKVLQPEEIWSLVDYVLSLPYEPDSTVVRAPETYLPY
jgi:mono/diheme cytochrome c family protein